MKNFLYISLIATVFLSSLTSSLASADTNTSVFFMKANSSARINIEFTFSTVGNWTLYPLIYSVPNSGGPVGSIIVVTEPSSLNLTISQSKYNVTYTITPKNNVTGAFEIYTGFCGNYYPLVVGLNQSKVNSKIFEGFGNGDNFGCSPYEPNIRTENVVGYSGMLPVTLSENSSTSGLPLQSSATPEFPFAEIVLLISIASLVVFYRLYLKSKLNILTKMGSK